VTAFDYVVIVILALSVVLGFWRGMMSEVLALAAWIVAFWLARAWGSAASALFSGWIEAPGLRLLAGMVAVFVGVLIVFALGRKMLSYLLRAVGLGWLDRCLGGVFGVLRGLMIVVLGVLLLGMTTLPGQAWWQRALLSPPLEVVAMSVRPWLPETVASRIHYPQRVR
jgi:membrane protein required for colicin V production